MSASLEEAMELANEINDINKERQEMVAAMAEEAIAEVEENFPAGVQWRAHNRQGRLECRSCGDCGL